MARECAFAMLFWAVVQAAFAWKYGPSLFGHAVVLAVGGFCLLRWKSRGAAVALALYALINMSITLAINSGVAIEGGKNLALALMISWTAVKAVEATFRLQGRFAFLPAPAPATHS
ncbi:hypothetical protein EDC30_10429 [Paucimonas lemoignei]|uniref:Uncharacterized protein n=2 Tax=Paucimonas lemoignei TaxID=29443 RepID=A0A4R3HY66_PAULE|nr:hypothetical protein EDC30_10429 [Paucimonas lemoignei]